MRLLLIMKFLNLIGLHLKMKNEANLKSKSQRYKKFRKMFQNQSFLEIYVPLHFSQLLSSYEQKNHTTSRGLAFIKFVDEFLKTSHLLCKEIESESSIEILLSKMFPGLFSLFLQNTHQLDISVHMDDEEKNIRSYVGPISVIGLQIYLKTLCYAVFGNFKDKESKDKENIQKIQEIEVLYESLILSFQRNQKQVLQFANEKYFQKCEMNFDEYVEGLLKIVFSWQMQKDSLSHFLSYTKKKNFRNMIQNCNIHDNKETELTKQNCNIHNKHKISTSQKDKVQNTIRKPKKRKIMKGQKVKAQKSQNYEKGIKQKKQEKTSQIRKKRLNQFAKMRKQRRKKKQKRTIYHERKITYMPHMCWDMQFKENRQTEYTNYKKTPIKQRIYKNLKEEQLGEDILVRSTPKKREQPIKLINKKLTFDDL